MHLLRDHRYNAHPSSQPLSRFASLIAGGNDPTDGITSFLHWRRQFDVNKEVFKTVMCLLKLCNEKDEAGSLRASTEDPWLGFLAGPGRDLARLVLSFKLGEKR